MGRGIHSGFLTRSDPTIIPKAKSRVNPTKVTTDFVKLSLGVFVSVTDVFRPPASWIIVRSPIVAIDVDQCDGRLASNRGSFATLAAIRPLISVRFRL